MSYCRNNGTDSDVYLIMSDCYQCDYDGDADHTILNCMCEGESFYTHARSEMIRHLLFHQNKGLMVPLRAYERLINEWETKGNDVRNDPDDE